MDSETKTFGIYKYDMKTDYEVIPNVTIKKEPYGFLKMNLDPNVLCFEELSDGKCREVYTEALFQKVDETHYYNEDTGLVFDYNDRFIYGFYPFTDFDSIALYSRISLSFLNQFEMLKKRDDELRSKSQLILLKQNKKYTNEEEL